MPLSNPTPHTGFRVDVEFYGLPAYVIDTLQGDPNYGMTRKEVTHCLVALQGPREARGDWDPQRGLNLGELLCNPTLRDLPVIDPVEFTLPLRFQGRPAAAIDTLLDRGFHGLCREDTVDRLVAAWTLEHWYILGESHGISFEGAIQQRYIPIRVREE